MTKFKMSRIQCTTMYTFINLLLLIITDLQSSLPFHLSLWIFPCISFSLQFLLIFVLLFYSFVFHLPLKLFSYRHPFNTSSQLNQNWTQAVYKTSFIKTSISSPVYVNILKVSAIVIKLLPTSITSARWKTLSLGIASARK